MSQASCGLGRDNDLGDVGHGPTSRGPPRRWSTRMRTKELSEYLQVVWGIRLSPATLHKRRCQGGGVPFQMDGRFPTSTPAQADAFAVQRLGPERQSTSDTGQQMAA